MSYVIERTDHGRREWVAREGSRGSFTTDLTQARVFVSLEQAQAQCCPGNERPVHVSVLLCRPEQP